MSEFLSKAQEQFIIYRLLILKVLLTLSVTFCLAWQTALAQGKWSKLDGDEKFYTACCIIALMGDKLIAFVDKTVAQLSKGKLPVDENGPTQGFKKDEKGNIISTSPLG